ncbi:hypothetical protein KPL71_021584 [Citrus sinensis]|uniref:Uncharacterized protein n=1 Tax=Citrus sinensis TaxID=2711 RepID=A0ACB8JGH9_CITSI|nr:hypothetical protein KPL71_021584 [Citrus sinensis]
METTSTSSSTPSSSSSHISLSSTLSLPKSCSKHITSKIENLVEYSYIPESAQINESQFPVMSPYNLYKQKTSFTRSICTLISTKRPLPKEYIQSCRLDQCALQAPQSEQYVTLEIPPDLVANWKREGYTHLHLGGVRLILTLHGRKGLPVTARIALLDTRFKQYQHAVIGTVLTTLHAGSVLLTFYPNFNFSLEDPNLPTTIKNHALDLPTPHTTSDALMILADIDTNPTIIQIPKQIQKQELLTLMPLEWLTNYEHFHQNSEPVQTTEATFERRQNGQVKLSFQTPETKPVSDIPQLFYTATITAVQTETIYESNPSESDRSSSFSSSTNSVGTSIDFESEYVDITSILMATKTEDPSVSTATPIVEESSSDAENQAAPIESEPSMPPPVSNHSTKQSSASWFTFNDIPRHKWPTRLQEFAAWIDLQGTKPNAQPESVLREFMARSTGSLRDWLESLGEYRQVQFMQAPIATALNIIHEQFIGERTASKEADRKEYHQIRYSSDSDDISIISTVQNVNQLSTIPRPSLKMSILPSKFHKPVPIIGFTDTGADTSMIDPSVLSPDFRGKKRLVIDYQPLNSFLKDDKFPLPKIQTLFVHLQGARIFSKFNLKAGFWQLGISPVDRPKTAFCIPDAHYQWTVMPFGLKVAPSLFQKTMTKIFNPILHHALFYIDDILLFSPDHDSHQQLLLDFFHIVQVHGIMLSEKKSSIAKESIDFLSMVITNGHYQPGPHIGPAQTEAVKQLKVIAQSPPPLRIPTTGQRILQTDASDDYWSAILLERIDGMDHFCAYASGPIQII